MGKNFNSCPRSQVPALCTKRSNSYGDQKSYAVHMIDKSWSLTEERNPADLLHLSQLTDVDQTLYTKSILPSLPRCLSRRPCLTRARRHSQVFAQAVLAQQV